MGSQSGEDSGETLTHNPQKTLLNKGYLLEAEVGIEPTMQLLQSRALPLGYPAASNEVSVCRAADAISSFVAQLLTCESQLTTTLPQFLRFKNSYRRDDAGDQFRRRHVKTRIARTARRIRHANVFAPD